MLLVEHKFVTFCDPQKHVLRVLLCVPATGAGGGRWREVRRLQYEDRYGSPPAFLCALSGGRVRATICNVHLYSCTDVLVQ